MSHRATIVQISPTKMNIIQEFNCKEVLIVADNALPPRISATHCAERLPALCKCPKPTGMKRSKQHRPSSPPISRWTSEPQYPTNSLRALYRPIDSSQEPRSYNSSLSPLESSCESTSPIKRDLMPRKPSRHPHILVDSECTDL